MKKCLKIIYLTGTRAEFGLLKPTLLKLNKKFNLGLIVSGTHLSKKHGYSIKEIEQESFKILAKIRLPDSKNDLVSISDNMAILMLKISKILKRNKPDLVLVEGDRGEQLAMAIVSSVLNIPIIHSSGGAISGNIDDSFRNAITKLAHIHLASTKKSALRIIKMNEETSRIYFVGTPINNIFHKINVRKKLGLLKNEPVITVLQHPVSNQVKDSKKQMKETLEAIKELKYNTILIYPNSDPGSKEMIKEIEKFKDIPHIHIYKNLESDFFMNLLKVSSVIVGNSSAGIVESSFFNLPAINIGIRQRGRECGNNIINSTHKKDEIKKLIKLGMAMGKGRTYSNPYKNDKSFEDNVIKIISCLKINSKLLTKNHPF